MGFNSGFKGLNGGGGLWILKIYVFVAVYASVYVQSYVPILEKCEDSACRFNETA